MLSGAKNVNIELRDQSGDGNEWTIGGNCQAPMLVHHGKGRLGPGDNSTCFFQWWKLLLLCFNLFGHAGPQDQCYYVCSFFKVSLKSTFLCEISSFYMLSFRHWDF